MGQELDLIFNAVIDQNWYLYSSDFDPDLGPIVTEFTFEPDESYELVGEIRPINPKKKYDDLWEGEIHLFCRKRDNSDRQLRSSHPTLKFQAAIAIRFAQI